MFIRLVAKMSDRFLEQRINIKFCVKLGRNASDTCEMLFEACWGEGMKKSRVFEWHKRIKEGCENMEDDERSSGPIFPRTDEYIEKNSESGGFRWTFKYQPSLLYVNIEAVP